MPRHDRGDGEERKGKKRKHNSREIAQKHTARKECAVNDSVRHSVVCQSVPISIESDRAADKGTAAVVQQLLMRAKGTGVWCGTGEVQDRKTGKKWRDKKLPFTSARGSC